MKNHKNTSVLNETENRMKLNGVTARTHTFHPLKISSQGSSQANIDGLNLRKIFHQWHKAKMKQMIFHFVVESILRAR